MLFRKRITYHQLSDEELVSNYRNEGSSEIIGEIYKRYGHLVMGTCMKYLKNRADAEDMTMTCLLRREDTSSVGDDTGNVQRGWCGPCAACAA